MRLGDIVKTWRVAGTKLFAELWGGLFLSSGSLAQGPAALVYSAAPVPDLSLGNQQVITVTNNTAMVVGAPLFGGVAMAATVPVTGGIIWFLTLRNASGGAHGAITFNAVFKLAATAIAITDTNSLTIAFAWNGTNHVELWRGAADVPN